IINKASFYVKQQKPYVKEIDESVAALYSKKKTFIDLNNVHIEEKIEKVNIKKDEIKINEEKIEKIKETKIGKKEEFKIVSINPNIENLKLVSSYPFNEGQKLADDDFSANQTKEDELKKLEELKLVSMEEFDKADDEKKLEEKKEEKITVSAEIPKQNEEKQKEKIVVKTEIPKQNQEKKVVEVVINKSDEEPTILSYEELVIQVDSNTNLMIVNAKINNELKQIKEYRVSTAKKDVKKPFGEGKISKISLNPIWYPTKDTLKTFRKRGINLPSVVPPGHKYNYMGAAKINLTHIVDGKNTFRIHGTLNESTIGTNESAGCIRMKNSDVLQLASLLNDFSEIKSLNDVRVILK
ncbi:MAG: L,D-transpeptidase, partial [Aliarcobacter sp.]|nr:L,D-transpeptidase [Aliarcobacter sp.]